MTWIAVLGWMARSVCLGSTAGILGVSGCATTYHVADETGGYYQKKVPVEISGNDDTFKVGFLGNGLTTDIEVIGLAMQRITEIGRQLGYKYFSVNGQVAVPGELHGTEFTVRYFAQKPDGKFRDLHEVP
jgi:hypothetical protein